MRLLRLRIEEPLPGRVMPHMAASHGEAEAVRRYRAIVLTTLRQLQGLADVEIQIIASPEDATEAIRFWLLPQLAPSWRPVAGERDEADGWRLRFCPPVDPPEVVAEGEVLCPWLGARLVHAALLGLERHEHRVVGLSGDGVAYLQAAGRLIADDAPVRHLPTMPVIVTHADWLEALDGPLGPALKRAHEAS